MTITTLYPSSVVAQGPAGLPVAYSGAASALAAVKDASDSSYIKGVSDLNYIRFALDNITLTGTQRVRSVHLRIRNSNDGSGGTTQDTLSFINSSIGAHTGKPHWIGGLTSTRGTTAITTWDGPYTYNRPDGLAWGESSVNDLQLQVGWYKVHYGPAGWQNVYELQVAVDITTQPSAGTVTVTNTTTARPNVAWVYSQSDGYGQYKYRVKLYDSVTYGAAGFNPDVSTAAYDSGDLTGDAADWDLTKDVAQGVTYKAYVRAAMWWPGPQGSTWWSAWSASTAFGVSFVPPATPTVAAVVLSDGQQHRTAVTVTAPLNLLNSAAASFEDGTTGGWIASTNGTGPTNSTTDAADGTHSLQLSSSAAGTMLYRSSTDSNGQPSVDGGVTYTALVSFHAATAGRSCNAGIRWLDITGAQIGSDVFGANVSDVTTAGVYTQASYTGAAPGNAVKAYVLARVQSTGGAAEVHRIDKASLMIGSSTTWAPGASVDDHTLYLERGERVDPSRGPADNWAHPQVASGGSVLQDPSYGFNWDTTKELCEWIPLDKAIPGGGPYGMVHWQPRDPASGIRSLRIGAAMFTPDEDYRFPVVVAQLQVLSYWAWVSTGTLSITPKIEWLDDTGAVISTTTGSPVTLSTTPQQIILTGTTPSSISAARGLLENTTGANTADIYVTRIGWGLVPTGPGCSGVTVPVDDEPAAGGPLVWTPVRFAETAAQEAATFGPTSGQIRTFNDFEATPGRPVLYRARIGLALIAGGQFVISANSPYLTLLPAPPPRTMLRSATDPTLACVVHRPEGVLAGGSSFEITQEEDAAVFHPLGRDGGPVKIRDWVGGEDGTLIAITTSEKQARRLREIIASSTVHQVQWQRGGLSYIMITGRSYSEDIFPNAQIRDVDDTAVNGYIAHRKWTLAYIETTVP